MQIIEQLIQFTETPHSNQSSTHSHAYMLQKHNNKHQAKQVRITTQPLAANHKTQPTQTA